MPNQMFSSSELTITVERVICRPLHDTPDLDTIDPGLTFYPEKVIVDEQKVVYRAEIIVKDDVTFAACGMGVEVAMTDVEITPESVNALTDSVVDKYSAPLWTTAKRVLDLLAVIVSPSLIIPEKPFNIRAVHIEA